MTERSGPWDGSSVGDATEAAYDAPTEFARFLEGLHGGMTNRGGVVVNKLNKLAVTAPGSISPCTVASGWAYVYGTWYESDSAVSVSIPTPAVSTRIDRIVLRKDWAAQTLRVTRIAGTEGAGAPAITQTVGTTWDLPIAQVSITTGGVITLTDQREFIPKVSSDNFDRTSMFNDAEGNPSSVQNAASDGVSTYVSRREHIHNYNFDDAEGDPADIANTPADGVSLWPSRRDHAHRAFNDGEGEPTDVESTTQSDGTSVFAARREHRHQLGILEGVSLSASSQSFNSQASVNYAITFDTEIFDDSGMHSGSSDIVTIQRTGKYLITASLEITKAVGATFVTISVPGTSYSQAQYLNDTTQIVSFSFMVRLTATNTVSISLNNGDFLNPALTVEGFFGVQWIGK